MAADNKIELARWYLGSFTSLAKWDFKYTPGKTYNLKVTAIGDEFTCYVDGKEVGKFNDDTIKSGTVGLYTYTNGNKQGGEFDNLKVVSMKQE